MFTWPQTAKKICYLGFGLGVSVTLILTALFLISSWFENRVTNVRTWNEMSVSQDTVKVVLRTQVRGGLAQYQFTAAPTDPALIKDFDRIAKSRDLDQDFEVQFFDNNGFKLCDARVSPVRRTVGENGLTVELAANDNFVGCVGSELKEAKTWNVSYKFPKVEAEAAPAEKLTKRDIFDELASEKSKPELSGEDEITGFGFGSGNLETKAGHTFHIGREGEQISAGSWGAGQKIEYSCKKKNQCLVENAAFSESVHATLIR